MINLKPLRGSALWENILCGFHYYSVSLSFLWDARNAVDNHVSELQIQSIHKLERLNASMRDSDLENAVRAKLENDPQLKSADLRVNADAVRNEVTLSGTVRTHAARKKAIELAKSTKPGVAVNDKIDVKPAA
jgi:osmotically-inducible protein OsmY